MDDVTQKIWNEQVASARAKRRAELVAVAAQLFRGLAPAELYQAHFERNGSMVLRVFANGCFRIADGVDGRILVEGNMAELVSEARHAI